MKGFVVDVSEHNDEMVDDDWQRLVDAGLVGIIARYKIGGRIDALWEQHRGVALEYGLPLGAYSYWVGPRHADYAPMEEQARPPAGVLWFAGDVESGSLRRLDAIEGMAWLSVYAEGNDALAGVYSSYRILGFAKFAGIGALARWLWVADYGTNPVRRLKTLPDLVLPFPAGDPDDEMAPALLHQFTSRLKWLRDGHWWAIDASQFRGETQYELLSQLEVVR